MSNELSVQAFQEKLNIHFSEEYGELLVEAQVDKFVAMAKKLDDTKNPYFFAELLKGIKESKITLEELNVENNVAVANIVKEAKQRAEKQKEIVANRETQKVKEGATQPQTELAETEEKKESTLIYSKEMIQKYGGIREFLQNSTDEEYAKHVKLKEKAGIYDEQDIIIAKMQRDEVVSIEELSKLSPENLKKFEVDLKTGKYSKEIACDYMCQIEHLQGKTQAAIEALYESYQGVVSDKQMQDWLKAFEGEHEEELNLVNPEKRKTIIEAIIKEYDINLEKMVKQSVSAELSTQGNMPKFEEKLQKAAIDDIITILSKESLTEEKIVERLRTEEKYSEINLEMLQVIVQTTRENVNFIKQLNKLVERKSTILEHDTNSVTYGTEVPTHNYTTNAYGDASYSFEFLENYFDNEFASAQDPAEIAAAEIEIPTIAEDFIEPDELGAVASAVVMPEVESNAIEYNVDIDKKGFVKWVDGLKDSKNPVSKFLYNRISAFQHRKQAKLAEPAKIKQEERATERSSKGRFDASDSSLMPAGTGLRNTFIRMGEGMMKLFQRNEKAAEPTSTLIPVKTSETNQFRVNEEVIAATDAVSAAARNAANDKKQKRIIPQAVKTAGQSKMVEGIEDELLEPEQSETIVETGEER